MPPRASRLKPWLLWTLMLLLMALMVHGVIETAVQLFFAKRTGVWHTLSDFREKAQKDGLSLEDYGKKLGL
ncbi:MAG: hypothetical protein PHE55_09945, partial [Methylococcaceae bacterium]|nr:hypothetical protein [Methylococcaceae bacterium]